MNSKGNQKRGEALTIPEEGPATREALQELLHSLVLHCIEYMERVPMEKRSAAHLGVIRQLVKDNGVALDAAHKISPARALQALKGLTLPFGAKGH